MNTDRYNVPSNSLSKYRRAALSYRVKPHSVSLLLGIGDADTIGIQIRPRRVCSAW